MRKNEHGNALFLILIAVALFAALSYAVTSSGRGSGSISSEQRMISAAQVTQFGASIRTTVIRMVLTGSAPASIGFDTTSPVGVNEVFAKEGGGAIYQATPANIGANGVATMWEFADLSSPTDGYYVADVGTNTDVTGREAIAYIKDITETLCLQINKGLGLPDVIGNSNEINFSSPVNSYSPGDSVFDGAPGQPFACIVDGAAGYYYYYHVLIEQ